MDDKDNGDGEVEEFGGDKVAVVVVGVVAVVVTKIQLYKLSIIMNTKIVRNSSGIHDTKVLT